MANNLGWLFPGQGSQFVGMGLDWAEQHQAAKDVFDEADEALGFSLSQLCFEGPAEELTLTANTQPAILATSIAMFRCLPESLRQATATAGHSLGEYSALVAAGVLPLSDALRLVRRRGELMQEAVPQGLGAMAAVIGLDRAALEELVAEISSAESVCAVANFNSPEQTVLAGHTEAIDRARELAVERGAKMAVPLPVSAPFHSPLMAPAREGLTPDLEAVQFSDPVLPVISNVDAQPMTTGQQARDALIRQIDSPVRWVESVQAMVASGVEAFVEIGPGKVLSGLSRRIDKSVRCRPVVLETPEG